MLMTGMLLSTLDRRQTDRVSHAYYAVEKK